MSIDIITVGELLVEFVSHTKGCSLKNISDYSGPYPSGAPAIFIDQAARMGARTGIYGGVGKDGFGDALRERLAADGVNIENVFIHPDFSTGVAFVSYFEDGNRTFIFHLAGTAADSFPAPIDEVKTDHKLFHISASSLGNPAIRNIILKMFDRTIAQGGKVSCDPNVRPELMRDEAARSALHYILDGCNYVLPSTSDLGHLYPGLSEEAAIDRMQSSGSQIIALKRGSEGALIVSGDTEIALGAHKVQELDPTGAGDCFCGTFLALLAQGFSLEKAGHYANAAGALSVTKRGPMEGNSTLQAIEQFISQNQPYSVQKVG